MARNANYKKIMNSTRWRDLRNKKLHDCLECEECAKKGKFRMAQEVHHIIPIESARDLPGMESLAFDYKNLESVCKPCHHEIHDRAGSHQRNKENMKKFQSETIDSYFKNKF